MHLPPMPVGRQHGPASPTAAEVLAALQPRHLTLEHIPKPEERLKKKAKRGIKCLRCNYFWKASLHAVLNSGTDCPKCANRAPLVTTEVLAQLTGVGLTIIPLPTTPTLKASGIYTYRCQSLHEWDARLSDVLRSRKCPKCPRSSAPLRSVIQAQLDKKALTLLWPHDQVELSKRYPFRCEICFQFLSGQLREVLKKAGKGCAPCARNRRKIGRFIGKL